MFRNRVGNPIGYRPPTPPASPPGAADPPRYRGPTGEQLHIRWVGFDPDPTTTTPTPTGPAPSAVTPSAVTPSAVTPSAVILADSGEGIAATTWPEHPPGA